MHSPYIALVFFFYGLAFFSMGLAITLEAGRGSDARLKHALRPLAAFGFLHGIHEWMEMFEGLHLLPGQEVASLLWASVRFAILSFSFLSLGAFGTFLLASDERWRRLSLLISLTQALVWSIGIFTLHEQYPGEDSIWPVAEVWTRYVLAIPSSLMACAGLIAQQRAFRRAGLMQFGRDTLWAAVAFAWYGIIGQFFTRATPLPPSNVINQDTFLQLFGFPIQIARAVAAIIAALFVIRFLRAFEVETQNRIAALQSTQLQEAHRREILRGELLRRVVSAQEAERQRIARELHDETGQTLTAIGLGLRGVSTMLDGGESKATPTLRQLETIVAHAINELQHIIADLRPSHLDDLGLPATLRWYASEVQERTALEVAVEVTGEPREIELAVKTALFRVAQEALTNVVKHAKASRAQVSLVYGAEGVTLRVQDDGRGFDMNRIRQSDRPTWGLLGMEERASLLGGQFRYDSRPGEGTRIEISIPYHPNIEVTHGDTPSIGG